MEIIYQNEKTRYGNDCIHTTYVGVIQIRYTSFDAFYTVMVLDTYNGWMGFKTETNNKEFFDKTKAIEYAKEVTKASEYDL